MRFTLTYQGPLPSKGSAPQKKAIRDYLSPQVARLWKKEEFRLDESKLAPISVRMMGGRQYIPLIGLDEHRAVDLSVLLLRRDDPASLFVSGGDLDNRMKTLFDALQSPQSAQECGEGEPIDDEQRPPTYTVVEDDRLITALTVRSERWLTSGDVNEVLVVLDINLRATKATWGNIPLLA